MNIEQLRAVLKAATPGPWEHRFGDAHHGVYFAETETQNIARNIAGRGNFGMIEEQANAKFIATFNPELVGKLLDELEAARKVIEMGDHESDCHIYDGIIEMKCNCGFWELEAAYEKAHTALEAP